MEKVNVKNQVLFENRSLALTLDDYTILQVIYKNRASNEEYLINLKKQVELVQQHKVAKALFDLRKMGVLTLENQKYTSEVYMPEITRAGLRISAIIVPEDVFGEVSAQKVTTRMKDNNVFEVQYFTTPQAGLEWLRTIK